MCAESGYKTLSSSTLLRILKAVKTSQRKSLSGLDDVQASAMNAFDFLCDTVKKLTNDSECVKGLENGKRYLKTRYQLDCTTSSELCSHNQNYALSDPSKKDLSSSFNVSENVSKCVFELFSAIDNITKIVQTESDEDLVYDVKKKTGDIVEYMKHLMRDAQQMKAKSTANLVLDNNTALWLKDYAQKVLPEKHCEGSKEYFGKKGMSVHIDVLLTKNMLLNELVKHVYYTVLYRCEQTLEDTLSITENVLNEFKKDQPEVTKMFMKSDNAGCYHANFSAE